MHCDSCWQRLANIMSHNVTWFTCHQVDDTRAAMKALPAGQCILLLLSLHL